MTDKKPNWYPKLPKDYDNAEYIKAFRLLDPPKIPNITPYTSDRDVIYWTNKAFEEYMKTLVKIDRARKLGNNNWMISIFAKQIIVNMDILPIILHSGIKLSFVDFDPEYLQVSKPYKKPEQINENDFSW